MDRLNYPHRTKVLRKKVTCPKCKHKSNVDVTLILDEEREEVFEIGFKHDREKMLKLW